MRPIGIAVKSERYANMMIKGRSCRNMKHNQSNEDNAWGK
jgi:hypothetical protein